MRQEPGPTETPADQIGTAVVRPDRQDEEQDPAAFGTQPGQRLVGGQVRRGLAEPDDERQERDVQRAEDRRHPGPQTITRIELGKGSDGDQGDADTDEEQAAAFERCWERRVEDDDQRERGAERCEASVAGAFEQPEDLPGREDGHECDGGRHDPSPDGEHDQQDRHEHRCTDRPLLHGLAVRSGQRPKRRCRLANSRSALSNASGPKSGHRASHE